VQLLHTGSRPSFCCPGGHFKGQFNPDLRKLRQNFWERRRGGGAKVLETESWRTMENADSMANVPTLLWLALLMELWRWSLCI
jgi:hypothetical protein